MPDEGLRIGGQDDQSAFLSILSGIRADVIQAKDPMKEYEGDVCT